MYGTHVYLRSPSWREGDFVELSNVTGVDAQDSNLRITFIGEQPRGMRLCDAAEVGIVFPDGSRMMCVGQMLSITCLPARLEARAFVYEFGVVSADLLPIHVDEAERRANIAAKADAERLAKLETEEPDDRHEKRDRLFQMIMQDMKEIRDLIEGRIDAAERAAL